MSVAALPWYDLPELLATTDAWWNGLASHLRRAGVRDVPDRLERDRDHREQWADPRLLLSQACGYDVLYDAREHIVPVATPHYGADGCRGPRYRSVVVVRDDLPARDLAALRGAHCVINEATSHSGNNALRPLVAPLCAGGTFFGAVSVSGTHTDSLLAVQQGRADVACIDAVVFDLFTRERPAALRGIRSLARTGPALAPPYVTSARTEPARLQQLRQGLFAAMRDPALQRVRDRLLLRDVAFFPPRRYRELAAFERVAQRHGYHELPAPRTSPLHRPQHPRSLTRGACSG